jgi:hypothetical protein
LIVDFADVTLISNNNMCAAWNLMNSFSRAIIEVRYYLSLFWACVRRQKWIECQCISQLEDRGFLEMFQSSFVLSAPPGYSLRHLRFRFKQCIIRYPYAGHVEVEGATYLGCALPSCGTWRGVSPNAHSFLLTLTCSPRLTAIVPVVLWLCPIPLIQQMRVLCCYCYDI